MKTLRKQLAAVILTLTLAVSTYAGQLNCPGAASGTATTLVADVIVIVVTVIP